MHMQRSAARTGTSAVRRLEWQNSQPRSLALLAGGAVAVGDAVVGAVKARQALGVHLQQIAQGRAIREPSDRRAAAQAARMGRACAIPSSEASNRGPNPCLRA